MYDSLFLYLLFALFFVLFGASIYIKDNLISLFLGIFNILIALSIITLEFGTRYVSNKEMVDNTTKYVYETNIIEIPEIIIALIIGMLLLQLLLSIKINSNTSLRNI